MLDFTKKESNKFIKEFVDKIKAVHAYQDRVKQIKKKEHELRKQHGGSNAKGQIRVKGDISKYLVSGRKICYCQAQKHNFINNCVSCGKVVCE